MNPFDLPGPEFLLFYIIFSVVVIAASILWRRGSESGSAPKIDLSEPYLIAYLRGGEKEAMAVALVSLIDRGLLVLNGTVIERAANAGPHSVRRTLEKALMETYAKPGTATSILIDPKLQAVCENYREALKRDQLLPDHSLSRARILRFIVIIALLGGTGAFKVYVAYERGRSNVQLLIILMIVAVVIAGKFAFPRLTGSGAALVADIQTLYAGLKQRAGTLPAGGASVDVMMLAAAFGVGALAGDAFNYTRTLFPRARSGATGSSWGSSSSCSSGSSCGSSCGGGGCGGGCGGCGS